MNVPFLYRLRVAVVVLCVSGASCGPADPVADAGNIREPPIDTAGYCQIARRIFANEAQGQARYLTYWGAGENFPSFGIGHFIWFPAGADAPFDESFPAMFAYVAAQAPRDLKPPAWLARVTPFAAPWDDKAAFDARLASDELADLREWLSATATLQARFIVDSFVARWNNLDSDAAEKQQLAGTLRSLLASPAGLFAVIDYYNFKGLGTNPRERYHGTGWGLLQVLGDIAELPGSRDDPDSLVAQFARAAARRLETRVQRAPPERGEARWLAGWLRRVGEYASGAAQAGTGYRVTPYLQDVQTDSATLVWFSHCDSAGRVLVRSLDETEAAARTLASTPHRADALMYHAAEPGHRLYASAKSLPYRHEVRVTGLAAAHRYGYEVIQDNERAGGVLRTAGSIDSALRFIVYADSETEPESTGEHVPWPVPDGHRESRRYLVDQSTGYAENLRLMRQRAPAFVAIAGDLVQSGGEQRDWDEYWRQNALLAASTPFYPAPGNHEYFGGPGALGGYTRDGARRAIAKYKAYFAVPENNAGARFKGLYYVTRQGPATLIVIDPNNGMPERSPTDTNWYLSGDDLAPAWQPDSRQFAWLRATLARAQRESPLTFVMFHPAPYSSGIHNRPPGIDDGANFASGLPLRSLTPLFLSYGVDAVFSGHDEQYEHSVVRGSEQRPDGTSLAYDLHFFVVGIGGDGLRGPEPDVRNPWRVFLAHDDAPETYDARGILTGGGKHYGHLEVNIDREADGRWHARFEPVYALPVANGNGYTIERRVYEDVTDIYTRLAAADGTH